MGKGKDYRGYVFGAALASAALGGIPQLMQRAHAASVTAAAFTFETSYATFFPSSVTTSTVTATSSTAFGTTGVAFGSVTGSSVGPFAAESGVGSAYGVHASTATVFSTPSGNGSAHSLSANNFAVGDYYQFSVPTTALSDVMISFDQAGSATGPDVFELQYSLDGTNYSNFASYSLPFTAASSFFASGTSQTIFSHSFDLSAITGLAGDSAAAFRLVDSNTGTAGFNPASATATGGSDRVDNFVVAGDGVVGTPEPTSLTLGTVAAAALILPRRRRVLPLVD